jgi:hypothetical protein
LPLHFLAPGLQSVQLPETQAAEHAVPSTQLPMASHVSGVLLLHCCDPGLQAPAQVPAEQTNGQTAPLLAQCPPESQICG